MRTPTPARAIAHLVQAYEYFQHHGAIVQNTFRPIVDVQEYEAAVDNYDWYKPVDPADESAFAEAQAEYSIQLLSQFAEYQEMIVPFVDADCLRIAMFFANCGLPRLRMRGAEFIARAVAHKKFAHQFVEDGGVQLILEHASHELTHVTIWFLSVTIYRLSCIPGAMELILALDDAILMEFLFQTVKLLEVGYPQVQRYIILFFSMAVVFPKVLAFFDQYGCLQHVLSALGKSIGHLSEGFSSSPSAGPYHRPVVEAATGMIWQYVRYHFATTMQKCFNEFRETAALRPSADDDHLTTQLNLEFDVRNAAPTNPMKPIRADSEDIIRWNRIVHHVIATEGSFPGLDTEWRPYASLVASTGLMHCYEILMSEDNRYGTEPRAGFCWLLAHNLCSGYCCMYSNDVFVCNFFVCVVCVCQRL